MILDLLMPEDEELDNDVKRTLDGTSVSSHK